MKLLKKESMPKSKLDNIKTELKELNVFKTAAKHEINSIYGKPYPIIDGAKPLAGNDQLSKDIKEMNKLRSRRLDAEQRIREINKQIPILERIIKRDNTIKEILS